MAPYAASIPNRQPSGLAIVFFLLGAVHLYAALQAAPTRAAASASTGLMENVMRLSALAIILTGLVEVWGAV